VRSDELPALTAPKSGLLRVPPSLEEPVSMLVSTIPSSIRRLILIIGFPTGCVPKKIMWYTADVADNLRKAPYYGFGDEATAAALPKFNWSYLKKKRDAYIRRLNGI